MAERSGSDLNLVIISSSCSMTREFYKRPQRPFLLPLGIEGQDEVAGRPRLAQASEKKCALAPLTPALSSERERDKTSPRFAKTSVTICSSLPRVTTRTIAALLVLLSLVFSSPAKAIVVDADIVVYGGTSGGVTAAVAAARLGKTVALISLNNHLGGMTASGLGVTDISLSPPNEPSYIGGLSREFYIRVGQQYGSNSPCFYFEPKVAERVFWQMATNTPGITVYTNFLLASATVVSNRVTQITTLDGSIFRAKQFIDTTYEGDLMAAAGVTFTWGRESSATYNENQAGIRSLGGSFNYDPYVIPGNTNSGLLPLVNTNVIGAVGSADQRLQAYNFRLCLTQNATNKIAIAPPTNYSAANYELVRRYVNARAATNGSVSLSQLIHIQQIIPNGKTDINANGELSTDYVGYNYTWATNTYAGRAVLRQQHEDYIRGLLYFYQTATNIPANLNTEAQSWGLAKDEFTDTGGWPWQIYVREARRMVSGYVMTQSNFESRVTAPFPICLARYDIDSHGVQRIASGGWSRWEGGVGGSPPVPYPISYRSIVPRTNECQNIFTTFALSASHVAFASCRMEPVFMMTSHAAGVAAAFAIDDNVAAQDLNYNELSAQLRADGLMLNWAAASGLTNGIIVDNSDTNATVVGSWSWSANAGYWGTNSILDGNSGKGTKSVTYVPTIPVSGTYQVYAWWVASSASFRDTRVPIDIVHPNGTNRIFANQQAGGAQWNLLFTTNFNAGTDARVIIRNDGTTNFVNADAIRFLGVGGAAPGVGPTVVEVVASDAVGGLFGTNTARFSIVRSGDTNLTVPVSFTVSGSAVSGTDYAPITTNVTLGFNVMATNIFVTPLGGNLNTNFVTVTLTLSTATNYTLGTLSNATVTIQDRPINIWRRQNFTATEQTNSLISGDTANPAGDGLPNLLDYALGLSPKVFNNNPFRPFLSNGVFTLTYPQAKAATDVSLTVEWSPDLRNWFSGGGYTLPMNMMDVVTNRIFTVQPGPQAGTNSAGYFRFRANRL